MTWPGVCLPGASPFGPPIGGPLPDPAALSSQVGAAAEDVGHPWAGSPVEAALTLPANTGVPP